MDILKIIFKILMVLTMMKFYLKKIISDSQMNFLLLVNVFCNDIYIKDFNYNFLYSHSDRQTDRQTDTNANLQKLELYLVTYFEKLKYIKNSVLSLLNTNF